MSEKDVEVVVLHEHRRNLFRARIFAFDSEAGSYCAVDCLVDRAIHDRDGQVHLLEKFEVAGMVLCVLDEAFLLDGDLALGRFADERRGEQGLLLWRAVKNAVQESHKFCCMVFDVLNFAVWKGVGERVGGRSFRQEKGILL